MRKNRIFTDVVVVGSGIAGMLAAMELANYKKVTLITKSSLGAGNSIKAQGGIAAALDEKDSAALHIKDTLHAGHGYNNQQVVKALIKESPSVMQKLFSTKIAFDKDHRGHYQLAKEGAHSQRRIFHAGGDATGYHIMKQLKAHLPDYVEVLEHVMVEDAIMDDGVCRGVYARNSEGEKLEIQAAHTVLATGGCGQLYSVTSNAEEATGDGMAIAFRAGAELSDMEFLQFHPTMLFTGGRGAGLLSEAIRGEGGQLIDQHGRSVMKGKHPLEDLAPRSVVSKAVFETIQQGSEVYLSVENVQDFEGKFPTIAEKLREHGIDLERGWLPVRPGAHFMMGGVTANEYGETSVPGLFAIGETACTGMHGANRLASNSLLEGAATAMLLARRIVSGKAQDAEAVRSSFAKHHVEPERLPEPLELQTRMDDWVGIIKQKDALEKMKQWLESYTAFIFSPVSEGLTDEEITMKNMLTVSWMITHAAIARTESRGAHIREDVPAELDTWKEKQICWNNRRREPFINKKPSRKEKTAHEPIHS